MTVEELLKISAHKVRNTPSLMSFYIETFINVFDRKPNCAGCTFSNDFKQLKNKLSQNNKDQIITTSNNVIVGKMEKTFKLKTLSNKIVKYAKNGAYHRIYDNKMNEEFAVNYLTFGSPEEIETRKKEFHTLPEILRGGSNVAKLQESLEEPKETPEEAKEIVVIQEEPDTEIVQEEEQEELESENSDNTEVETEYEGLTFNEPAEEEPKETPAPAKKAAAKTTAKK